MKNLKIEVVKLSLTEIIKDMQKKRIYVKELGFDNIKHDKLECEICKRKKYNKYENIYYDVLGNKGYCSDCAEKKKFRFFNPITLKINKLE